MYGDAPLLSFVSFIQINVGDFLMPIIIDFPEMSFECVECLFRLLVMIHNSLFKVLATYEFAVLILTVLLICLHSTFLFSDLKARIFAAIDVQFRV